MASSTPRDAPRVLSVVPADNKDTRWIGLYKIDYVDEGGKARGWEMASRRTRRGEIDAVALMPILKTPGEPSKTLLITQFRPPVKSYCVEFPAGLVDAGETPETAALRELKEETGYIGTIVESSEIMVSDPGMTDANMKLVVVEVDMTDPVNAHPIADLEDGEYIQKHIVALKDLEDKLLQFRKDGYSVDARLFHLAIGFKLSSRFH